METLLTITTPATSTALTTLGAVKDELALEVTDHDARLTRLIAQASAAVATFLRFPLARETVSETFRNPAGSPHLPLARIPVASIASVTEDGTALAAADYEVDAAAGLLYRLCSDARARWTADKIVVAYAAGYLLPATTAGNLPGDIERACILTVMAWHRGRGRDPTIRSERVEDVGETSYLDPEASHGGLPYTAAVLLEPHVRRAL